MAFANIMVHMDKLVSSRGASCPGLGTNSGARSSGSLDLQRAASPRDAGYAIASLMSPVTAPKIRHVPKRPEERDHGGFG